MKKILQLVLALFIFFSCPFSLAQQKVITFGTDPTFTPYENYDGLSERIIGYDIELSNAICQQLLAKCVFTSYPFGELLPRLERGEFDAVISGVSITPARLKVVDFTQPYFFDYTSLIFPSNAPLSLTSKSLMGKNIGVQKATTDEDFLKVKFPDVNIKSYDDIQEALSGLKNQQLDGVLSNSQLLKIWIDNQPPGSYQMMNVPHTDKNIYGYGFGIAVRKGNKKLLNDLNWALNRLKANGTYQRITQEYFGGP